MPRSRKPTTKRQKTSGVLRQKQRNYKCAICLKALRKPIAKHAACGHRFHRSCLKNAVVQRGLQHNQNVYLLRNNMQPPRCPMCNTSLGSLEEVAELIGVKEIEIAAPSRLHYYQQPISHQLLFIEKQPVQPGDVIKRLENAYTVQRVDPNGIVIQSHATLQFETLPFNADGEVEAMLFRPNPTTREQLAVFHHLYTSQRYFINGAYYTINRFREPLDMLAKDEQGRFRWIRIQLMDDGQRNFHVGPQL
jgi:hypothetical protein